MKLIILFLLLSFTPTKTNAIPKEKTIQKTNYRNSVENNKLINFLNSYLESEIINLDNVKNTITKNKHLINLRVNKNNPLEVVLDREDCKTNAIHTEDEIFKIIKLLLENGAEINFTYESPYGESHIIFDFLYLITNSRFYDYMKLFIKHDLTVNTKLLIERVKYHRQFAKETELESFQKTLNLLNGIVT